MTGKTITKGKQSANIVDGRIVSLEISAFANKGARIKTLPLMQLNKLGNRTHEFARDYEGSFTDKDGVTHEEVIKNTQRMVVGETAYGILTMEATTIKDKSGNKLAYFVEPIIYAPEVK